MYRADVLGCILLPLIGTQMDFFSSHSVDAFHCVLFQLSSEEAFNDSIKGVIEK